MTTITADWIRSTDDTLSRKGVSVKARPWDAWRMWSTHSGSCSLRSPEATAIFDWYTANYGPKAFAIGWRFTGALYFDAAVWPVNAPICFGTVPIDINGMVDAMPPLVRDRMYRDTVAVNNLVGIGVDCLDYGAGFDDLQKAPLKTGFAQSLLLSADKELRAAIEILLSAHPTQKAAEAARMATEMFLKCFLAHHDGLDDQAARELSHDLDEALKRCLAHDPNSELQSLQGQFGVFPTISERYSVRAWSLKELWIAYSLAQIAGTCLVRTAACRDVRPSITMTTPGRT